MGGNYLGSGYVCGMGGLLLFSSLFFVNNQKYTKKLLIMLSFALCILAMLFAGGRGPLLFFIIASAIPFLPKINAASKTMKLRKCAIYAIPALTIVAVLVGYLAAKYQIVFTTIDRIMVLFESGMGNSAGARLHHWQESITLFLNNPFGYGIGSYPILSQGEDIRLYPHNIFLEIAVELGIVGLFLFLLQLFLGLYQLMKTNSFIQNEFIRKAILMLFIFLFGGALISGDLHDNRLLFMSLGLMGW